MATETTAQLSTQVKAEALPEAVANSASRIGIQLQGYDQAIALSQQAINDILERHYEKSRERQVIKLKAPAFGWFTAKCAAPKVLLHDDTSEKGDYATYIMRFEEGGQYVYEEMQDMPDPLEMDDPTEFTPRPPVYKKVPVDDWQFAFTVSLKTTQAAKVPDDIASRLSKPGVYTAQQLALHFGVIQRTTFDLERTETPGLPESQLATVRGNLAIPVNAWIDQQATKSVVLGYALTVNGASAAQQVATSAPSFPPTAVKPQIVANRPAGNANAPMDPENDYNAFIFTEMTADRPFPKNELTWTGNFFYGSIGGTLAMSRGILWDQFLVPKINDLHYQAIEKGDKIIRDLLSNEFGRLEWFTADYKPSSESTRQSYTGPPGGCSPWEGWHQGFEAGLAKSMSFSAQKSRIFKKDINMMGETAGKWTRAAQDLGAEAFGFFNKEAGEAVRDVGKASITQTGLVNVHTRAFPLVGQNRVRVLQYLEVGTGVRATIDPDPGVASFGFNSASSMQSCTDLVFSSVTTGGSLHVNVVPATQMNPPVYQATTGPLWEGLPDPMGKYFKDLIHNSDNGQKMKQAVETAMKEVGSNLEEEKKKLQEALNGQKHFIFPGGGTFDMKDPVFSRAGDLLIGLSYRKAD